MSPNIKRPRRLLLKPKELQENLIALYGELQRNERAKSSFIQDPTGQIARRVVKRRLPPQQVSEANRLLFAILANDEMVKWLQGYGGKTAPGAKLDKRQFALDLARQIQRLNDPSINAGVLGNAALGVGIPGLGEVAYQCVCNELPNKYDCACTPVAKDTPVPPKQGIEPELVRALTEHLVQHAKDLSQQGKLADLGTQVM